MKLTDELYEGYFGEERSASGYELIHCSDDCAAFAEYYWEERLKRIAKINNYNDMSGKYYKCKSNGKTYVVLFITGGGTPIPSSTITVIYQNASGIIDTMPLRDWYELLELSEHQNFYEEPK